MFKKDDLVWFRDEVTDRKREAKVLRVGKEQGQTFYVLEGSGLDMVTRIALPRQLRIRKEVKTMEDKWQSKKLYEHPAPHQQGRFGHVALSGAGVYYFRQGYVHMSCPQDWAAKIQHDEESENKSD